MARFTPSTSNERLHLLLRAARQALDNIEAASKAGEVPAWVEDRLHQGVALLRYAEAYAAARSSPKFQASEKIK